MGQAILEVNGKTERNEMLEAPEAWRRMLWDRFVFYVCRTVVMGIEDHEVLDWNEFGWRFLIPSPAGDGLKFNSICSYIEYEP